jgi:hypothetical protein
MDSVEMTKPEPGLRSGAEPMPVSCCPPFSPVQLQRGLLRSWIGNRYVLAIVGLAIAGSALALGWSWLTAVGAAPLIVSTAPSLVMCAVGGCMMCRRNPGAIAPSTPPTDTPRPASPQPTDVGDLSGDGIAARVEHFIKKTA